MDNKKVLLVVPTRGRPEASLNFYEAFKGNSQITDLMFGLDDDDAESYPRIENVLYEINPRMGMNGTLNHIASKYADKYDYIAFMGDDHRIRTAGWDVTLTNAIGDLGLAYGNDLLMGESLATAVVMSSNIIRAIGFMAPPKQKHLYLDNFWMEVGKRLGRLHYRGEVIIEHMHFSVGKSEKDALYEETNSSNMYDADRVAFEEYMSQSFEEDIKKIEALI